MVTNNVETYFETVIRDYISGDIELLLEVIEERWERPGPLLHCTVAGIDAVGGMVYGFIGSEKRSVSFMEKYFELSNEEGKMIYGLARCGIAHEGTTKLNARYFAPFKRVKAGHFLYKAPDNSIWLNVVELARSFLDALNRISHEVPTPLSHVPSPRSDDPTLLRNASKLITRDLSEDFPDTDEDADVSRASFNPLSP